MEQKTVYTVNDIEKLMNCKRAKAYQIIKDLNDELTALGSKVILGRIPAEYFHERYKGFRESEVKQ